MTDDSAKVITMNDVTDSASGTGTGTGAGAGTDPAPVSATSTPANGSARVRRGMVLFAHGARDPRWAQPFERLRDSVRAGLPDASVELGFLELMTPRLPELLVRMVGQGITDVTVVPVFLGQGGHVLRDLPLLVDAARVAHPRLRLTIAGAVGENADVQNAMTAYCVGCLTFG
jgi:sirohydrochlorin cobaltochelatase